MAKINNSAVIQKLIDELNLYPGTDVIPTELAEKILPVFQINSQDVNVQITPSNIVRDDVQVGNNQSDTLHTVTVGKHFYLTSANLSMMGSNSADDLDRVHIAVTIDGTVRQVFSLVTDNVATHEANGQMTFASPIKCDPGSPVNLVTANGEGGTTSIHMGTICGYEA